MPILSLLDNDLYKFTMQHAVLDNFPGTPVEYRFTDRRPSGRFNDAFVRGFSEELERMSELRVSDEEIEYVRSRMPFLNRPDYLTYLKSYRFDPDEVSFEVRRDGRLELSIQGMWGRSILWEVPILAAVSEQYFRHCEADWSMEGQPDLATEKARRLSAAGLKFADFGTRRRRNSDVQSLFIERAKRESGFVGTSNVHFAREHDVTPIGTMAHEWIMGVSGLDGLRRANREALRRWARTFRGNLGIALSDTFGTGAFFEDFAGDLARLYDGVRHDSGDPIAFGERVIAHYHGLGVKPEHKTIVFSDSLDVDKAVELRRHFEGRINVSFGIGTHFTNDFADGRSLSIVIKMWSVAGVPVVKISDEPAKAQGDPDALRVARWTFEGAPLDQDESLTAETSRGS
ncbi:nicotinate phosphoribosyltransferase [Stratiformator vulcanicus]|uniref:Nicotinate phosphoribosyltransferase n=1 Tax=Stratiformator vulcanicus TaxID=2527980 RepID=A0A517R5F7_9PLAN|nr:nicotinate phosphoribosyltransferase [Stratiformator vulcanicus]QDT39121.1 Nicotinate phosphoribosyltransferase 2 [Stratiformator vulcanicus]